MASKSTRDGRGDVGALSESTSNADESVSYEVMFDENAVNVAQCNLKFGAEREAGSGECCTCARATCIVS